MTCSFIGHRKIANTNKLETKLFDIIENLIINENVDVFLFGSRSEFNTLCHKVTSDLKKKHPHIKRVYVRAEYPYINKDYLDYILEDYEDTYYPEHIIKAGKAGYIERNCEMIDKSNVCVVYLGPDCSVPHKKASGTKIAFDYAVRKNKKIINVAQR